MRVLLKLAFALFIAEFPSPHNAATLYWDTDNSSANNNATTGANLGGSGSWINDPNWWNGTAGSVLQIWSGANDVIFAGTPGEVVAASVLPRTLTFKSTGYSITSGRLTVSGLPANFQVDTNVTVTISSEIAGANTMIKIGPGTLILANPANVNTASTTTGGWRIDGGTLQIVADTSLGAALPDIARNTITDIQINQATIQFGDSFDLSINRRTKLNTNASTNRGDAIIDTRGQAVRWFGSIQGGPGSLRVINSGPVPGILTFGTDKLSSINPFGSSLPAGSINLTISDGAILQTAGTVTPTNGELGAEINDAGQPLAIKLDNGQIRSESGGYFFQRHLILGPGGGSLDVGAWDQTFTGTVSGPGRLSKEGFGTLTIDNPSATWTGGTRINAGTLQLGRGGSHGLLPGAPGAPSSITIAAGATLKFNRGSDKSFFDTISGQGGVTIANTPNTVVRLVANNSYLGPTTITSGALMIGQGNPNEPGLLASRNITINSNAKLIFNRVEDMTYNGSITGAGALEKQAAGKLNLSGTHDYTGPTLINSGTLFIIGEIQNSPITVNATLSGTGAVSGPVTIQPTGALSPGASIGTLTINNTLTLSGNTVIELNAATGASDQIRGLTAITYGGKLTLTNLQGALTATNTFKLFEAQSYTGAFATLSPSIPGANLTWNTNSLATDGTLRINSITSPTILNHSLSGNTFTLSWPQNQGWRLQTQTNPNTIGLSNNWADVPNSSATNEMTFPKTADSTFYRLILAP